PAPGLPQFQDRPTAPPALAGPGLLPHRLGATGRALPAPARDQLGSGPPRRLQEAVQKGGEATGPSPVDRSKSGTALHLTSDPRAMPLGVVLTGASANDGVQTKDALQALVVRPPEPERQASAPVDHRSLPTAQADGAYGNRPTRQRAQEAGFRMQAPKRG